MAAAASHLDVATRAYRFRILNASNARTYRLGFADAAREARSRSRCSAPTAGCSPRRCAATSAFSRRPSASTCCSTSPHTRLGDAIVLETRAFDPMHFDAPAAPGAPGDARAFARARPARTAPRPARPLPRPWPEGRPRRLLTLQVRERVTCARRIPASLSALPEARAESAAQASARSASASPRAAGASTIACSRWTRRRSRSRATPPKSGCCAITIRACRMRCTCTGSSSACSSARRAPMRSRRSSSTTRDASPPTWAGRTRCSSGPANRCASRSTSGIRSPARRRWMFHCHNLEHEDGGMMLRMKVG